MFDYLKLNLQELLDAGISRAEAIARVIHEVESEKSKRKKTIEEAVEIAASYTVSQAFTKHRSAICRRAEAIVEQKKNGTEKLHKKVAGLMRFRLPSGIAIADATGAECIEAASYYSANAAVYYFRANFLSAIGKKAGDSRVGDVMQESDLQAEYENAKGLAP